MTIDDNSGSLYDAYSISRNLLVAYILLMALGHHSPSLTFSSSGDIWLDNTPCFDLSAADDPCKAARSIPLK